MNLQAALSTQYKAALLMLRQAVERCPDEIWTGREHPRNPWRIAYHAVFFVHLYLMPNLDAFVPWEKHRENADTLWATPPKIEPYTQAELIAYIDEVYGKVDEFLAALDFDAQDSGFDWYPNFPKLDHVILGVRHIQGHVGQLSEILFEQGIDTDWIACPKAPAA